MRLASVAFAVSILSFAHAALAKVPHGNVPVWLMGNTFHTSLVLRTRDVPYWREISGNPRADELAFGFGAAADYHGPSTAWTIAQAIFPNHAVIHVVPIEGPVTQRFPNSDVVLLRLTPAAVASLAAQVRQSFALRAGKPVFMWQGHFPDARFYRSREIFYFPYVCNEWIALKLRRVGVPIFLPRAILAESLAIQAAPYGYLIQRHHGPEEHY